MSRARVSDLLRLSPGQLVDLDTIDPSSTPGFGHGKKRARREVQELAERLSELHTRLHAASRGGSRDRVLLLIQGSDCSGKDGIARHVVRLLEPMWLHYAAFGKPTEAELRHHFLWRIRRQLPEPGQIVMHNRSHYEDVLVARVHNLVAPGIWQKRYAEINSFEQRLIDDGLRLVKVMLHLSPQEQRTRLLGRLEDPAKRWKYNPGDVDERAFQVDYKTAYEAALAQCSTAAAPWFVVPADRKWYRDWAVANLLLEALQDIDPQYPPPDFDVATELTRLEGSA
ncbi:MAG: PPK2 family polyphosphate kinase [Pseudonocardiales bacterium]